jgi:hypothetical protein
MFGNFRTTWRRSTDQTMTQAQLGVWLPGGPSRLVRRARALLPEISAETKFCSRAELRLRGTLESACGSATFLRVRCQLWGVFEMRHLNRVLIGLLGFVLCHVLTTSVVHATESAKAYGKCGEYCVYTSVRKGSKLVRVAQKQRLCTKPGSTEIYSRTPLSEPCSPEGLQPSCCGNAPHWTH